VSYSPFERLDEEAEEAEDAGAVARRGRGFWRCCCGSGGGGAGKEEEEEEDGGTGARVRKGGAGSDGGC
jgi:hypothetical protein